MNEGGTVIYSVTFIDQLIHDIIQKIFFSSNSAANILTFLRRIVSDLSFSNSYSKGVTSAHYKLLFVFAHVLDLYMH